VQLIPDGQIYIESAMPGAGTKLEKPEVFFSAEQASDGEVLLMPVDKVDAVQSAAKSLLGRPFDDQLALDDDGKKLYCTELVALALRSAGVIKDCRRDPFLFCLKRSLPLTIWLPQPAQQCFRDVTRQALSGPANRSFFNKSGQGFACPVEAVTPWNFHRPEIPRIKAVRVFTCGPDFPLLERKTSAQMG
jgi:hypothetical protein